LKQHLSNKVMMCDPPLGWKYGFPKPIPNEVQGQKAIEEWLVSEGYPQWEIDSFGMNGFYCRYWEKHDD
jgi:hypothetical protein